MGGHKVAKISYIGLPIVTMVNSPIVTMVISEAFKRGVVREDGIKTRRALTRPGHLKTSILSLRVFHRDPFLDPLGATRGLYI